MLLPLISACKWEPPDQLNKFEESNCFLSEMNWSSGASIFIWTTSCIYRDKAWEEKQGLPLLFLQLLDTIIHHHKTTDQNLAVLPSIIQKCWQ
jgi:hypothetical protein